MSNFAYAVDIVFYIDKTFSMKPVIDLTKESALRFHADLSRVMEEKTKKIDKLRIRTIAFGDIYADGADWLKESSFFELPDETDSFNSFIKDIRVEGGGDEPENGLEALALAMNSDWTTEGTRRRHIIVLYTDASAHSLELSQEKDSSAAPVGLAKSFEELSEQWVNQSMESNARRLILYAPDANPWTEISNYWNQVVHFPSKAGSGLEEVDYGSIIDAIANSV